MIELTLAQKDALLSLTTEWSQSGIDVKTLVELRKMNLVSFGVLGDAFPVERLTRLGQEIKEQITPHQPLTREEEAAAILAILREETPLLDWTIEDWPHEQGPFWVKGKVTFSGGKVVGGDAILSEDVRGKPGWVESVIPSIGHQLGNKLTDSYNREKYYEERYSLLGE